MNERIAIVGTASTSIGSSPWDDDGVRFWTVVVKPISGLKFNKEFW